MPKRISPLPKLLMPGAPAQPAGGKPAKSKPVFGKYHVDKNGPVKCITESVKPGKSSGTVSSVARLSSVTEPFKSGLFTVPDGQEPVPFSNVKDALKELLSITLFGTKPHSFGAYAEVWQGRKADSEKLLAIKIIDDEHRNDPTVGLTQGEVCVLDMPRHASLPMAHILLLKQKEGGKYYLLNSSGQISEELQAQYFVKAIVSDYLRGEELFDYIQVCLDKGDLFPARCLLPLFRQITNGAQHLWFHGYIHRDIKAGNIIFNFEEKKAWLIDYGMVRKIGKSGATSPIGTSVYMGPETFVSARTGQAYSFECDCWSLGSLFMYVLTGWYPSDYSSGPLKEGFFYQANTENLEEIVQQSELFSGLDDEKKIELLSGFLPKKYRGFRLELLTIAVKLLRLNASERMSLNEVVNHLSSIKAPDFMI